MPSIISIQRVKTPEEMRSVYKLTHDTFIEKNLIQEQENQLLMNNLELDSHEDTQVIIALVNGEICGTISITVHQKIEEVYNYAFFSTLLDKHYDYDSASYSGWRLATKGNPILRYLLTIRLIMEGSQMGLNYKIPQAYFSFIPEQLKIYKKIFPQSEILGAIKKKTKVIDSELVLMKYEPCPMGQKHLAQLYEEVLQRYLKLTDKS